MQHYWMNEIPPLRNPVAVLAFAGWNDAAEVATTTVKVLINQWSAHRFAGIESEDFYVFTDVRPGVRVVGGSQRRIEWPANDFYYYQSTDTEHDYVLLVGVEPNLRWRSFSDTIVEVFNKCGVKLVVTVGGLLADVPHTLPPRLNGSGSDPKLLARLGQLNVESTRYEGPTGIVGVVNGACRDAGMATVSLWGNVPHYIASTMNPRVSSTLLRSLADLLDLHLDLTQLEEMGRRFDTQISEAIAGNREVSDYVRQLEERERRKGEGQDTPPELPSSDALIHELEEFLKRRQRNDQ